MASRFGPTSTLSELLPHYLSFRDTVENKRGGTLINDRAAVRKLIEVAGDVQPRSLTTRHSDRFLQAIGQKSTSHFNMRLSAIKMFMVWCRREKLVPRDCTLFDTRSRKISRPDRHRVPVDRFTELLEAADRRHPRDRILMAVGLYLFLRASEVRMLKIEDVDLEAGELHVYVKKTDDYDVMPISTELDRELRRWLAFYEQQQGRLNPSWYLVPAKCNTAWRNEGGIFQPDPTTPAKLRPESFMSNHVEIPVKSALRDIGWPVEKEGMHTLRRSGARAYFDSLVAEGYDGSLKRVSAMLHHSSVIMTERYLGIREDRHSRNVAIKGRLMFPDTASSTENISTLRTA